MGVEAGPRELGQTDTAWSALEGPQGCQNTQPLKLYKSLWERPFNLSFFATTINQGLYPADSVITNIDSIFDSLILKTRVPLIAVSWTW